MLRIRDPKCLIPAYSPTCLTANLAPHHLPLSPQRQRALITLILRGLTRSIQSHCSIQYNHSHSLMRGRKRQTEKKRDNKTGKDLFCVFFIKVYHRFVFWGPHILRAQFFFDQYCVLILSFTVVWLCQSPSFLSSDSFHMKCLSSTLPVSDYPIVYHGLSFFGSLFLSLAHRCLMMVIFYPGPSVSWCGEALGPPLFLMRHDGKLPRALCCQIVTHCLVVISRQTPARVFTHTHVCRHLWLCALITLCEITTVTTAVWATPCFPGH